MFFFLLNKEHITKMLYFLLKKIIKKGGIIVANYFVSIELKLLLFLKKY